MNNASPATVSRAGIIYVSDTELGWQPVVASWLQTRPAAEAAALRPCFDTYVGPLLDYVRLHLRPVMHNEQVCQVNTLLTLLTGILKPFSGEAGGAGAAPAPALAPDRYERIFLYCVAWSLGGLLDGKDRPALDAQLRSLSSQMPRQVGLGLSTVWWQGGDRRLPQCTSPCPFPRFPCPCSWPSQQLSDSDTIFEFLVDEHSGQWQHWRERIPVWEYPRGVEKPKFTQLIIPTLDSVRYEKLLSLVHSVGKATLVRGGGGDRSAWLGWHVVQARRRGGTRCFPSRWLPPATPPCRLPCCSPACSWWAGQAPPRPPRCSSSWAASARMTTYPRPSPSLTSPPHSSSNSPWRARWRNGKVGAFRRRGEGGGSNM